MTKEYKNSITPEKHIYANLEEAEDILVGVLTGKYEFHRPKVLTIGKQRLTESMIRFVREYVIDYNASSAAIRSGYSKKSKSSIGAELITKPEIKRMIEIANAIKRQDSKIREQDVLNQYKWLAFSDIKNYYTIYKTSSGREIPVLKSLDELTEEQTAAIREIYTDAKGIMRIKLWDKSKALDSLALHLKMIEQTINLKNDSVNSLNIQLNLNKQMTEDELLASFEDQLKPSELK